MNPYLLRRPFFGLLLIAGALALTACGAAKDPRSDFSSKDTRNAMLVSVRDQRMLLVRDGKPVKSYVISTSKFGVGVLTGVLTSRSTRRQSGMRCREAEPTWRSALVRP
jgi:hypothetical protein